MSLVPLLQPAQASPEAGAMLTEINGAFGVTPAMFRAVANSPAALRSMWGSFAALGEGCLGAALGEKIAVAIANSNRCAYCLAAHTALGVGAGVDAQDMAAAQVGESDDARTAAALAFALAVVQQRGAVDASQVEGMYQAGFSAEEVVEVIAHVALNLFTNYVNNALAVPVDFPTIGFRELVSQG